VVAVVSYNWRLNAATMLFFTFVQVVVPLIPRYALVMGVPPFIIGLAASSVSITAIVFRPLGGFISDRWSRIKLMVIGALLVSVAYAVLAVSRDVGTVIASRIIEGVAVALFVPSSIASAVDYAPEGRVGVALGWRSLTIGVGFSLGPALGGFMAELLGYNNTFMVTALLVLTVVPLIAACKETPHEKASSFTREYISGLKDARFLLAFLSLVAYATAWMGLLTFLSAYLKIQGYGDLEIGLFVAIQAAASLVIRLFAGRAADVRPCLTTAIGLLVVSTSFFAIYLFEVPPLLYIASLVFGLGAGIYIPSSQTLALAKAPAKSRGFLSSIQTMGVDIGNLSGPTMLGALIERANSYQAAFSIAPFIPLIPALVLLTYALKNNT
jgi:MFS family permease